MDQDQLSSLKQKHPPQNWICRKCGASNHPRLKTCWKCNTSPIFQPEPRPTVSALVLYLITFAVSTSIAVLVILVLHGVYSTPIPISLFSIPITWIITAIFVQLLVPPFLEYRPETKSKLRRIVNFVFYSWFANFFLFLIVALMIGGVAPIGQTEPGKYYLFENWGRYTQVSYWVYSYSLIHEILVLLHFWLVLTSLGLSFQRWPFR